VILKIKPGLEYSPGYACFFMLLNWGYLHTHIHQTY
jgi:hypothetical protein